MADPKLAWLTLKMLTQDDEDHKLVITAILVPTVFLIFLLVVVVYLLITPLNWLTGLFFPQEAAAAEQFKAEYDYIIKDLEEYGGYIWPSTDGSDNEQNKVTIDPAEIEALISQLDIPIGKQKLIYNALSLVGKVDYFWGGKSKAGWNDAWGEPRVVSAAGSKNTGKIMPYGLDCSGFVDWAFKTSGYGNIMAGGTGYQWGQCNPIKEENLQPGDLAFKNPPGKNGVNHVGIYLGEQNGQHLYVHCAGGEGVTVDSWSGFVYFRRPIIDFEKEK